MQLSLRIHASTDAKSAADQVAALEAVGLDIVWVAEAYGYDGATLMGYIAARTGRVRIGSGILSIYSRPATLLAQTAAGLDHLSGGRAILGLGASNPQVVEGWFGVPFAAPVERTRAIIEICRAVWRREVVTADGLVQLPLPADRGTGLGKPLKMIPEPPRARIPVYVAASGPRNVALAAEVADGWMPLLFMPEHARAVWGPSLAAGRAARPASADPLAVVAGGLVCVDEHPPATVEAAARAQLALYLGGMGASSANFYADLVRRYGHGSAVDEVQRLYTSGDRAAAAAAVPVELVHGTNLIGPRGHVRERIAALREAGVSVLDVRLPAGVGAVRTIEALRDLTG